MSHPLILNIIPIALGTIILVSGFIAYKAPMSFEQKDTVWKYPMYSGEKALESKETWSKAQKIYGKSLIIIGVINLLISYPLLKLMLLFIDDIWKYEDCTIPAILFIVLPDFIGILLANVITRHKL